MSSVPQKLQPILAGFDPFHQHLLLHMAQAVDEHPAVCKGVVAILADGRQYLLTRAPAPGFDTIHDIDCRTSPDPDFFGLVRATVYHGGINPNGDEASWITLTAVLLQDGTVMTITPDLQVSKAA